MCLGEGESRVNMAKMCSQVYLFEGHCLAKMSKAQLNGNVSQGGDSEILNGTVSEHWLGHCDNN